MVDYTEIWHPQFYGNEETSTSYRIAAQYANVRRLTQFTPGTVYTVDPMNSRAARFVGRQGRLVEFEEENWVPTWGVLQWMDTHRTGRVKLRDLVDHSTTLYERPAIQYNRPYLNDCQVTVPWAVRHEWKTEAPLLSLLVVGLVTEHPLALASDPDRLATDLGRHERGIIFREAAIVFRPDAID